MDADDKVAASGQEGQPVRAKSPWQYPRHAAPRRHCMQYFERLLLRSLTVCSGSIAPIRFLKQRPFDQRFARLGSPNFERLLCRVFHCGCDDEQRLLCFETGHSRREFFEA